MKVRIYFLFLDKSWWHQENMEILWWQILFAFYSFDDGVREKRQMILYLLSSLFYVLTMVLIMGSVHICSMRVTIITTINQCMYKDGRNSVAGQLLSESTKFDFFVKRVRAVLVWQTSKPGILEWSVTDQLWGGGGGGGPLHWRHNDRDGVTNHQPHGCLLNRLFRRRSKKTSKLHVTGFLCGEFTGTDEFPAQRASYAENISIWWRHHAANGACCLGRSQEGSDNVVSVSQVASCWP